MVKVGTANKSNSCWLQFGSGTVEDLTIFSQNIQSNPNPNPPTIFSQKAHLSSGVKLSGQLA